MPVYHRAARSLRVLLVPPDPALALRLELQPDIEVVASTLERPAAALVEELASVTALLEEDPECRVLLLTGSAHPGLLDAALATGAAGLVLRDGPVEELAESLRAASRGETVVDPALEVP
ncbi:two-component system response regulator DesR [Streptomyces sp. 2132.2]|uniref:DNA-binding response regulator n=1 Tax=Streptomyces sp. 2132.2 TaxID=2485161 RepID=UPI000FB34728|nr:DNA-binding response regulator [Streptomyces sp. 2132.2]ROQ98265.1 two-component system response regulator DesR [Streptomyces sp. 2132.2]